MLYILPTDTCYGLAGELNEADFNEIYCLKGRDFSKQLAILVEDYEDMKTYIEITDEQIVFLRNYPHPWSFLGKRNPEFVFPDFLDSEKYQMISIRVANVCLCHREEGSDPGSQKRIPNNDRIASYTRNDETGKIHFPFFLTSANISGNPESKTLAEAREYFPGIVGYDGGICDNLPSDVFSIGENGETVYMRRNYGN